jgi:hypothetical protein
LSRQQGKKRKREAEARARPLGTRREQKKHAEEYAFKKTTDINAAAQIDAVTRRQAEFVEARNLTVSLIETVPVDPNQTIEVTIGHLV